MDISLRMRVQVTTRRKPGAGYLQAAKGLGKCHVVSPKLETETVEEKRSLAKKAVDDTNSWIKTSYLENKDLDYYKGDVNELATHVAPSSKFKPQNSYVTKNGADIWSWCQDRELKMEPRKPTVAEATATANVDGDSFIELLEMASTGTVGLSSAIYKFWGFLKQELNQEIRKVCKLETRWECVYS